MEKKVRMMSLKPNYCMRVNMNALKAFVVINNKGVVLLLVRTVCTDTVL